VIDPTVKRCLGQMIKGVQVVGAAHGGTARAYTSHWVTQVSFEEPVVLASVSPKHDTHPLLVASGRFSVSVLAADQLLEGQYFSYPGRKFRHVATELLELDAEGLPVVPNSIAWLTCEVLERIERFDHDLFLATVSRVRPGRLGQPPLLYSARHGWRVTGPNARERGVSVRDRLLARVAALGDPDGPAGPT
jgi:flavin reductase (DIM6/NTAB) family NADH-FMN oxidoreductase RutF